MFQTEFSNPRGRGGRAVEHVGSDGGPDLLAVVPIVWEEHCTECTYPTCYSTCDLYRQRADGHCARFEDGVRRIGRRGGVVGFGRWAKLEARLPARPVRASMEAIGRVAGLDVVGAAALRRAPELGRLRARSLNRYGDARRRLVHRLGRVSATPPEVLLIDVRSSADASFRLVIETAGADGAIRSSVAVQPGPNRIRLDTAEIGITATRWPDRISVHPEADREVSLSFDVLELGWLREQRPQERPRVKVVVWDLDGTVWDGTLVEDGGAALRLRDGVRETVEALDARGVLQSVASRNDEAPAMAALARLGLDHLILAPEIHWGPKHESVRRIAESLDLGLDTFLFVDDLATERVAMTSALPDVRVVDATDLAGLLDRPDLQVPVTADAAIRRDRYRTEAVRRRAMQAHVTDPDAFLRDAAMVVGISRASSDELLTRCLELFHRTNQLNLTTRRLTMEELRALIDAVGVDVHVIAAEDRFGAYGVVGVAVVDRREPDPVLTDFVTSCRVARKGVEPAVLEWLRRDLAPATVLRATFVPTERNAVLRTVLADAGFVVDPGAPVADDAQPLVLVLDRAVPRSDLAAVLDERDG